MRAQILAALSVAAVVIVFAAPGANARSLGGLCGSPPCFTAFTVNGGAPPAGVGLSLTQSSGQVSVMITNSGQTELSPAISTSDTIHMVLDVGTFDPVVFGTTGVISSFSESIDNVNNTLTIDLKPSASSWKSTGCTTQSCGNDTDNVYTATNDYTSMVLGFVSDLSTSGASATVKNDMRGTWFATNAQSMSLPLFNSSNGQVNFTVAAPHCTVGGTGASCTGGSVNQGFFQFFAPDALVQAMGISNPASIANGDFTVTNSNGGSTTTSVSHQASPAGVLIVSGTNPPTLPKFTYSSPQFTVQKTATAPGAPTGVSATAGNAQATVSFTAPASNGGAAISSYTVTASPGGATASGSSSPITVTGLTNGTSYTFTVTATNSAGTGSASSASSAVTPAAVPGAPTGVSASAGNAQATVSFTAPAANGSAITSYTVTASPGGASASGGSSPITVTGLTNGTSYTFTVTATNGIGTGAASSASSAVTPATVPGAPTSVSASAGDGQATVSFTAPSANGSTISSYTVTASPGGATASGSSSPITVTGLTNGTSYTFTVKATNGIGAGSASSASNAVTPAAAVSSGSGSSSAATVPAAPTGVSASAENGKATVSFAAPASDGGAAVTSYTVTASPGGLTASGSSSPITIGGLANGTSYTFTVTATNSVGASSASSPSGAVVPFGLPGAPSGVGATAGNGQATISFTAPSANGSAVTSYTVTASPGGATASGSSSPITIGGLVNCASYTFTVVAVNGAGAGPASSVSPAIVPSAGTCATVDATTGASGDAPGSIVLPPPVGVTGSSGPAVNWSSGTFGSNVTVEAVAAATTSSSTPPALSGFAVGSVAVEVTVKQGDTVLHSFDEPLEIVFPASEAGLAPGYSSDGGTTWVAIPKLSGTTLPSGQRDGYYVAADGTIHVLTRHATYFGVLGSLGLELTGKRSFPAASRNVYVLLTPARAATAFVHLQSAKGVVLKRLTLPLPAAQTRLKLSLPRGLRPGDYVVAVTAISGPAHSTERLRIRLTAPR